MDSERATPASAAPRSRASTAVLDSTGPGTPAPLPQLIAMTPPASAGDTPSEVGAELTKTDMDEFKPFQLLMETEITVEYGKKLKGKRTIHEELLCCYSPALQKLFCKAKDLREAYPVSNDMRRQLKVFVYPNTPPYMFEEKHMEAKVIPLIVQIYDKYPLAEYRTSITELVDDTIEEQVTKRSVTASASKGSLVKRDLKDMGIQPRLQGLLSKAVLTVAQRLSAKLREIKNREIEAAKTNLLKAAAQRRIVLPETEERVVRSLTHWLYGQGALNYEDAEHLYALQALANKLGLVQLAQQCLRKLSNEAEDMIQVALSQGSTLEQLLFDSKPDKDDNEAKKDPSGGAPPASNFAQVVFHHVLKDNNSPERLRKIVVATLAEHMEAGLFAYLEPMVTRSIALLVIQSMLLRRQIKQEEADVKLVNDLFADDQHLFAHTEAVHK